MHHKSVTGRRTDRRKDTPSYRVASSRLKISTNMFILSTDKIPIRYPPIYFQVFQLTRARVPGTSFDWKYRHQPRKRDIYLYRISDDFRRFCGGQPPHRSTDEKVTAWDILMERLTSPAEHLTAPNRQNMQEFRVTGIRHRVRSESKGYPRQLRNHERT